MRIGGAVQSAAGEYAELGFKAEGDLRIVLTDEVERYHADAPIKLPRAAKPYVGYAVKAVYKPLCQRQFMRAQGFYAAAFNEAERVFKPVYARHVGRAGFKPIRQVIGKRFLIRCAARAARDKRIERMRHSVAQKQQPYARRAEQALMPGHGKRAEIECAKINRVMPGGLRRIERKGYIVLFAHFAHGLSVLHRAAHV